MTTDEILLGVGLIVALAVGSQVLASRLKIPALILLLPAGFTAGAITTDVNPQRLLGATFQPLVSLNPVTRSGPPEPKPGDTRIVLGRPLSAPVIRCG